MGMFSQLAQGVDWSSMGQMILRIAAVLLCLVIHEVSHGLAAYHLGDPTAKQSHRLSLNPLRHLDPFGLIMMIAVGFGWAKPVPVDLRNFRRPRQDMALTALAGPGSNFLLALAALGTGSLVLRFWSGSRAGAYLLLFLCQLAVLSVGLGLFNLIPLPPLDGSKVLDVLLPERWYHLVLQYERYLMLAVVLLAWSGAFGGPLTAAMELVLRGLCRVVQFPFALVEYYFF